MGKKRLCRKCRKELGDAYLHVFCDKCKFEFIDDLIPVLLKNKMLNMSDVYKMNLTNSEVRQRHLDNMGFKSVSKEQQTRNLINNAIAIS